MSAFSTISQPVSRIQHLQAMRILWLSLALGVAALAQSPEAGRIERNGSWATLILDSRRPLDSAAITIAEKYHIAVNVEDPPYIYRDDWKDVTAEVARVPNPSTRVLVPKGGHMEVQFALNEDGSPADIHALLRSLIVQANAQFPFAYRLDADGDSLTIVPTRTRDVLGRGIEITPLLDRRVTIPAGTRSITESANMMAAELSAQTGLRVACCEAFVAGIPWGMEQVAFEAHDEPARSVLKRLIVASLRGQPNRYYWLQRCDPLPSRWCFINLQHITATLNLTNDPAKVSSPAEQIQADSPSPFWFKASPRAKPPKQ